MTIDRKTKTMTLAVLMFALYMAWVAWAPKTEGWPSYLGQAAAFCLGVACASSWSFISRPRPRKPAPTDDMDVRIDQVSRTVEHLETLVPQARLTESQMAELRQSLDQLSRGRSKDATRIVSMPPGRSYLDSWANRTTPGPGKDG